MNELTEVNKGFQIKTDFTKSETLIRLKKKDRMIILAQPSQVHEFVIQLILSRRYRIKGINFVVKDPYRILIVIQIQLTWFDRLFNKLMWERRCQDLTRMVSEMMPIGLCTIKPI